MDPVKLDLNINFGLGIAMSLYWDMLTVLSVCSGAVDGGEDGWGSYVPPEQLLRKC